MPTGTCLLIGAVGLYSGPRPEHINPDLSLHLRFERRSASARAASQIEQARTRKVSEESYAKTRTREREAAAQAYCRFFDGRKHAKTQQTEVVYVEEAAVVMDG